MNRLILILAVAVLPAVSCGAVGQKSLSYSFEYTAVSTSGAVAQSGSYNMMSRVSLKGIAEKSVGSASYTIEPLIGAPVANAGIKDWTVY